MNRKVVLLAVVFVLAVTGIALLMSYSNIKPHTQSELLSRVRQKEYISHALMPLNDAIGLSDEEIVKKLFIMNLEFHKALPPESDEYKFKLVNYKDVELKYKKPDERKYAVSYSVRPYHQKDGIPISWVAGNGNIHREQGWVIGKLLFITLVNDGAQYKLEVRGTIDD